MTDKWIFELGKVYIVQWLDHWSTSGWHDPNIANDISDMTCVSIGFCSYVDDNMLHLSTSLSVDDPSKILDGQCTSTMGIMKNCITDAWEILYK